MNYLKHRIKHPLETYNLYVPLITFFFPMDQFLLFGGLACLLNVLNLKKQIKIIKYKHNYILYIFTIYMILIAYLNNNTLGLVASFFLVLVTIYTCYVRYKLRVETFETMMIILGLGSMLSLYYTTVDFYTTSTYKLYQFMMIYIKIPYSFMTGIAENFRSTSTYINPNFYGHICAFISIVAVYYVLDSIKKMKSNWKIYLPKLLFYGVVIIVNLIGLRLTESRSAFIGLVLGLVFLLSTYNFKLFFILVLPAFVYVYLNPDLLLQLFPRVSTIELEAQVRIDLYLAAINEIKHNVLFGKGLYTMPLIIQNYGLKYQIHAHNLMLEVFLSSGFIGFLLLGYHFISPLIKPIETWIKSDHPYVPLVIGICALQIGNGFTDAIIVFPQTFILISLLFFSLEMKHENH